jgi:hypothetical protein
MSAEPPIQRTYTPANSLKVRANLSVAGGIILMVLGSAVANASQAGPLFGLLLSTGGWAWLIWGTCPF